MALPTQGYAVIECLNVLVSVSRIICGKHVPLLFIRHFPVSFVIRFAEIQCFNIIGRYIYKRIGVSDNDGFVFGGDADYDVHYVKILLLEILSALHDEVSSGYYHSLVVHHFSVNNKTVVRAFLQVRQRLKVERILLIFLNRLCELLKELMQTLNEPVRFDDGELQLGIYGFHDGFAFTRVVR